MAKQDKELLIAILKVIIDYLEAGKYEDAKSLVITLTDNLNDV